MMHAVMQTASHQLNNLPLNLMHGGTFEDNGVVWQSVNTEGSQKGLCYKGKTYFDKYDSTNTIYF